jgi:hypothetical protein
MQREQVQSTNVLSGNTRNPKNNQRVVGSSPTLPASLHITMKKPKTKIRQSNRKLTVDRMSVVLENAKGPLQKMHQDTLNGYAWLAGTR